MHLLAVGSEDFLAKIVPGNMEIAFLGWYFCASDAVSQATLGGAESGATARARLRRLWPRCEHGVPPRDQVAAGAGLGSGLLPHQVLIHTQLPLWSKKRRVFIRAYFPGVEESGVFLGTDKLLWKGRKTVWRISENVSVIFSQ